MIAEDIKLKITRWSAEKLQEMDLFLVDVKVSGTKIEVFVDGDENVTIEQCSQVSRFIEPYLDEDTSVPESYNLILSSPGMFSPLVLTRQYYKRIGAELAVVKLDGTEIVGKLTEVNEVEITLESIPEVLSKTQAKKQQVKEEITKTIIPFSEIKKATVQFKF